MLLAARNRIGAGLARTARRAELAQAPEYDGKKGMASWLRGHCRLSAAEASRVVRTGRTLERLPAVAAGCADGGVGAERGAVIARVAGEDTRAAAQAADVDVAEVDEVLAQTAAPRPYKELQQVVQHYLARLDPDGDEPDPTEGRRLVIRKHADGSVTGGVDPPPGCGGEGPAAP